jgi:hypothetical protein
MSYSYEARKLLQHGLHQQATGVETVSPPLDMKNLEAKVALRADSTMWDETCDSIEEQVEDLLIEYEDTFGSWKSTFSSLLQNQLMAAAVAIDEQGQRNMTNVTTLQTILEAVNGAYLDVELRHQFWPGEISQCRNVVVDIVDFLIQKCRETRDYYYIGPTSVMCSIDMQHTLENAFLIKQFDGIDLPVMVARFRDAFRMVYRDCCVMLWSGAYKVEDDSDLGSNNSDSSDDYDEECQCRASLKRNNKMTKSEEKCRNLQYRARNTHRGGPRVVPISRKMEIRKRKMAPSPLGRTVQFVHSDNGEREGPITKGRPSQRRRWFLPSRCRYTRRSHGKFFCSFCSPVPSHHDLQPHMSPLWDDN